jgi:choline dehydrogenase-like flavoprotein
MTTRSSDTLAGHHRFEADVVVVGAGAGGAACAYELARSGLSVVILEEGHRYAPREFPASYGWAINHIYADKGARFVEADTIYPMPGGKGVGGSTLINSAICYRAPDAVLNEWVDRHGLDALRPERLAPIYASVEDVIGVTEMHPLQARANNLFIKRGVERLGLDGHFIHRNAPGCVGCGICQLGCPSGGKGSVDRNFIPMAEELGAIVCADCKVEKVIVEGGRARGVEAAVHQIETGDRVGTVRVDARAVVLSAGSIGTPMILLRQALANRSGQVGRNLAIHPSTGAYGFVPEAINSWDGVPQAYAVFLDRAEGILLQTYNAPPEVFFMTQPWSGADGMKRMRMLKNLAMCGALVSDHGAGTVTAGRNGKPRIRYELDAHDRRKLVTALRSIVQILFAAGATEVFPGVGSGTTTGDGWETSEARALARLDGDVPESSMKIYASHPMGTCRMGVDPAVSVTDAGGQTHDVPGLYVADASLMPSSLGVNPQMTVMALGIIVARSLAAAARS